MKEAQLSLGSYLALHWSHVPVDSQIFVAASPWILEEISNPQVSVYLRARDWLQYLEKNKKRTDLHKGARRTGLAGKVGRKRDAHWYNGPLWQMLQRESNADVSKCILSLDAVSFKYPQTNVLSNSNKHSNIFFCLFEIRFDYWAHPPQSHKLAHILPTGKEVNILPGDPARRSYADPKRPRIKNRWISEHFGS